MCEIHRKGFPAILRDNDEVYFMHFSAIVDSIDELASIEIVKTSSSYHFRIAPSLPMYISPLLKEILKFNNQYGIRLDMSKSIKSSGTITFNIEHIKDE